LEKEILAKDFAKNLISISTDDASNMKGEKKSLSQLILKKNSKIYLNLCLSHGCNLVSQFAVKIIPLAVEKLIRNVYNPFSHSPLRKGKWFQLQRDLNIKPYKMLNYANTRWLSLEATVTRLLDRYEQLIDYFSKADISIQLEKIENKIYLQFLKVT